MRAPEFCSVRENYPLCYPRFSRLSFFRHSTLPRLQTKKLAENVVRGNAFIFAANSNFLEYIKIDFEVCIPYSSYLIVLQHYKGK